MQPFKTVKNGREVWCVDIPASVTQKRKRVFRDSQEAARVAANALVAEHKTFGPENAGLTGPERRLITENRARLTFDQMVKAFDEYAERMGGMKTATEAADEYLAAPRERELSKTHMRSLRTRLKPFKAHFGSRPIGKLSAGELEAYIRAQGGSAGNYYRVLRALFRYAEKHEWLAVNPFARIDTPDTRGAEKLIFTPDQMTALLRCAAGLSGKPRAEPFLRSLILGGFCGLRASEALALDSAKVDLAAAEIHVCKMKTQHTGIAERYASLEPVAMAWLHWLRFPSPGRMVELNESNLSKQRCAMVEAAGVPWYDNGLRRSFGSYHLAAFQDAARTAEIMGHTDAGTTKSKYRVPRRQSIALEWFALTPGVVLGATPWR